MSVGRVQAMPFQSEVVQEQVTKLKGMVLLPAMKTGEGCGSEALAQEMGGCEPMTRRNGKTPEVGQEGPGIGQVSLVRRLSHTKAKPQTT